MVFKPLNLKNLVIGFFLFTVINSSAQLAQSILDWDGTEKGTAALPEKLSATGFDPSKTSLFVPYSLNFPQSVNLTGMNHYVYISGNPITPTASADFNFPKGVILMRVIYINQIYGEPSSRLNLEFQMQVRVSDTAWASLVYVYDNTGTDANLITEAKPMPDVNYAYIDLTNAPFPYVPTTVFINQNPPQVGPNVVETYIYRFSESCASCHRDNTTANGFNVPQLNKNAQLQDLVTAGVLTGVPDIAAMEAQNKVTKFSYWDDPVAPLYDKVFSFLNSNCTICHARHVPYQIGMTSYFHFSTKVSEAEFIDSLIAGFVLVPGSLDSSLLYTNLLDKTMPQSENIQIADPFDVKNIKDWITTGTSIFKPVNSGHFTTFSAHFNQKNLLIISQIDSKSVKLFTISGKEIELVKTGTNQYTVAENIKAGLYIVKSETNSAPVVYNQL